MDCNEGHRATRDAAIGVLTRLAMEDNPKVWSSSHSDETVAGVRSPCSAAANKMSASGTNRETLGTAELDVSLGYSLRRAQLSTYLEYDSVMAKFEIRPSQYAVIVLIRSNPGASQSAISGALGIQKANFVAVLDRLEARGLIERRKLRTDKRASALYLTRTGEAFCEKLQAAHADLESRLAERLGVRRSRQFLKMLHEFAGYA